MRDDIILEDTTLRDGEQTPGVAFSQKTKTEILNRLIEAGVRWIEVGIPAMGGEELRFIQSLVERQNEAHLVVWHRGIREDVERTLDMGFKHIHVGLPTSSVHLDKSVRKDRAWLLETARSLISMAKDRDAFVSISAEDLARTEPTFLQEYAGVVHEAGADRLRLSDTIGVLTPEQYAERVSLVRAACDIDLQCHTHNDFGLGTANTLAGLRAGARYFHCTVNGIGERAGMADLSQMAVTLKLLYEIDLGLDLTALRELSRLVGSAAHHNVLPWQPIVGDNVFAHESGIHAKGMLKDTSTFEPFPPHIVGGERRYVLGKHSGRALVAWMLDNAGVPSEEADLMACLEIARQRSIDKAGPLSSEELVEIHRSLQDVIR